MGLACGLIGASGSGKTTVFNAVTAAGAGIFDGAESHVAMVSVPDPRLQIFVDMYHPQKLVPTSLKLIDIPAIKGTGDKPGRGSKLLTHLKDVDALLHVVRCFTLTEDGAGEVLRPAKDVEDIDIEMMVADSQTLQNKIDRMAKKSRMGDKASLEAVADCEKIKAVLDNGIPARRQNLTEREMASVYECNLVSLKPVLYVANVRKMADAGNKAVQELNAIASADGTEVIVICGRDEADISQLEPADRADFMKELGLEESSVSRLMMAAYRKLGLLTFFTVGEDEVRAWTCMKGDKAPAAAGKIHSDMEKGFIRMDVMGYEDLISLGSEAAVARAGKHRVEGKTYEVQEGDIVTVRFNK